MSLRDLIGLAAIGGAGWTAWRAWAARQGRQGGTGSAAQISRVSYIDQAKQEALTAPQGAPQASRGGIDPVGLFSGLLGLLGSVQGAQRGAGQGAPVQIGAQSSANIGGMDMGHSSTQPGNLTGLLDVIAQGEGAGYDTVYGGSRVRPPKPLTQMTVSQVMDWQDKSRAAGSYSTAAGRYQIINPTLKSLVASGVVNPSDRFDQATQDRAAHALLDKRGLSSYQRGNLSLDGFANNLAKEWASLPVVSGAKAGKSYYGSDGVNKARVSVDTIKGALRQV